MLQSTHLLFISLIFLEKSHTHTLLTKEYPFPQLLHTLFPEHDKQFNILHEIHTLLNYMYFMGKHMNYLLKLILICIVNTYLSMNILYSLLYHI